MACQIPHPPHPLLFLSPCLMLPQWAAVFIQTSSLLSSKRSPNLGMRLVCSLNIVQLPKKNAFIEFFFFYLQQFSFLNKPHLWSFVVNLYNIHFHRSTQRWHISLSIYPQTLLILSYCMSISCHPMACMCVYLLVAVKYTHCSWKLARQRDRQGCAHGYLISCLSDFPSLDKFCIFSCLVTASTHETTEGGRCLSATVWLLCGLIQERSVWIFK